MFHSLSELNMFWEKENTCGLKTSATQAVFGDGNEKSSIVFIGEAPGKTEDLSGKPFVGRAGKFLDSLFEKTSLKRTDVYITNTVKYRPPNNRDPLPEEKQACLPWLIHELEYIHPLIIVPLGRHALNTYLPNAKISEMHGTLIEEIVSLTLPDGSTRKLPSSHFFPLYHPAAAIYNRALADTLSEDFVKLVEVVKMMQKKKVI